MIPLIEIRELATEWGLPEVTVEKDYVLGWLLSGIARNQLLGENWVFKGGTCLKKCYMETWRFSEDLDFTVLPEGLTDENTILETLGELLKGLQEESGVNFSVSEPKMRMRNSEKSLEGRIYFQSLTGMSTPLSIRMDITTTEKIIEGPVRRPITHVFSDQLPANSEVLCYSFPEVFAEKIRAMGERTRPRDLYDIVNLYWRAHPKEEGKKIYEVLIKKCESKNIPLTTLQSIKNHQFLHELVSEWENMLGHQLRELPPLKHYMSVLPELFEWLEGKSLPKLPVFKSSQSVDNTWRIPSTVWHWGASSHIETIRFAAANHLCIKLGYRKENGEYTNPTIEPYSIKKTRNGNLVLGARRLDNKETRLYRIDRIESLEVTHIPFIPVFDIEIAAAGASIPQLRVNKNLSANTVTIRRQNISYGQKYVIECLLCRKRFIRTKYDTALHPHKMKGQDFQCSGRRGWLVERR